MNTSPPHSTAALPSPGRLFRDRRATPRPEPGTVLATEADRPWREALRRHWPEFTIEAGFLAVFLLVAGVASAWLHADASAAGDLPLRRLAAGLVTAAALAGLIYSPWGRRSGSHLNPAITLAYLRLGKIGRPDALFYLLAQVIGAAFAVAVLRSGALLPAASPPALLATSIAPSGDGAAFLTQLVLSGTAMFLILYTSNHASWFRWTGLIHAALMMLIVATAAPLSGFGMNVARLLAVDVGGDGGLAAALNLLPPLLGMQLAVEVYRLLTGRQQVLCAKLAHNTHGRCIFRCQHPWQARTNAIESIRRRAPSSRPY